MALLGIDLGGTKLSLAVFSEAGDLLHKKTILIEKRKGDEVGDLIANEIIKWRVDALLKDDPVTSVGICVPGIYHIRSGTVWAPNIPDWEDYPLLNKIESSIGDVPVTIDSDRACYILGEHWAGNAVGYRNSIYLSVGTGIGAGIMVNGSVLRGAHDIAGAIGWMALKSPFEKEYIACGCFETFASGEGIARQAQKGISESADYRGILKNIPLEKITCSDVFAAYESQDEIAVRVIDAAIECWGMAVANLVSLFNPEKIILGGGVFGPAARLIPQIRQEAAKWAQPISMKQVELTASSMGGDAGVYGAGFLAMKNMKQLIPQ